VGGSTAIDAQSDRPSRACLPLKRNLSGDEERTQHLLDDLIERQFAEESLQLREEKRALVIGRTNKSSAPEPFNPGVKILSSVRL